MGRGRFRTLEEPPLLVLMYRVGSKASGTDDLRQGPAHRIPTQIEVRLEKSVTGQSGKRSARRRDVKRRSKTSETLHQTCRGIAGGL
ncbi:MAG: hypothetical protein QXG97_02730 [Nitrososphaerota archaeon]